MENKQLKELIEYCQKRINTKSSDPRAYGYNVDMTAGFCDAMAEMKKELQSLQQEDSKNLPKQSDKEVVEIDYENGWYWTICPRCDGQIYKEHQYCGDCGIKIKRKNE